MSSILSRYTVNGVTGCYEWTGSLNASGYGSVGYYGEVLTLHRLAYEAIVGDIPIGLCVLHSCDNRKCFNTEHLFLGTNADNVADRVSKGRSDRSSHGSGEDHGRAILSNEDVINIRILCRGGILQKDVAIMFGVGATSISKIMSGIQWRNIA